MLRHAKSDWYSDANTDFERPLNKRGKTDAPRMGEEIMERGIVPDHILSSPAKRAVSTAKRVAKSSGYKGKIEFLDDFYFGAIADIIDHVRKLDNSIKRVMLVGHNPIWEQISEKLIDGNYDIEMPTASLVSIDIEIDSWQELTMGIGKFNWILNPKMLQ